MLERLESEHFLAVVGGSGSGKSSLVRAGLLPALSKGYLLGEGTDWTFITMRPGGNPFANLSRALQRDIRQHHPDSRAAAKPAPAMWPSPRPCCAPSPWA